MLRILFEFVGGPIDGTVVDGRLGEATDAERYYLFSNHGEIGQRFKVASPYTIETLVQERLKAERRHRFPKHFYVVTDHLDLGDEVLVRAEYDPQAAEKNNNA